MTPKAERTRQHIVDTALRLFQTRGYAETTLKDIAEEAGVATGLAYRYFRRTEELALALYEALSDAVAARLGELPKGSLGERWAALLHLRYDALQPHRRTLVALVAAAMDPDGELGVLSPATTAVRARWLVMHRQVLAGAPVPAGVDPQALTRLLYAADLLLVLIWTQDRSPEARATRAAVDAAAGLIDRAAPLLALPGADAALGRLTAIFSQLSPEVTHDP